jgi:hypothetical protein
MRIAGFSRKNACRWPVDQEIGEVSNASLAVQARETQRFPKLSDSEP